jgi:hypothetical protein
MEKLEKTVGLIDVDGVLAKCNVPCLLSTYNRMLKLDIPGEQLEMLSLKAFHRLPQVQAYQEKVGQERYTRQLAILEWHPEYVVQNLMIRDALAGVHYLAELADDLGYCTARVITFHDQWNADLARMTHLWLDKWHFPNHNQVMFCDGYIGKLVAIAGYLKEEPGARVVLIDDSADMLLHAYDQLSATDQQVLRRLTLVGFGYDEDEEAPVDHPLRALPLLNWHNVFHLEKEFSHELDIRRREERWRK